MVEEWVKEKTIALRLETEITITEIVREGAFPLWVSSIQRETVKFINVVPQMLFVVEWESSHEPPTLQEAAEEVYVEGLDLPLVLRGGRAIQQG